MTRARFILNELFNFGAKGMNLEKAFLQVCTKVGLINTATHHSGKLIDFQAIKGPWNPFFIGRPVNIKNYKARFLFETSELAQSYPWSPGSLPPGYDIDKAEREIYRFLQQRNLPSVLFLKPENLTVEDKLIELANDPLANPREIIDLLQNKRNWLGHSLGNKFGVHININRNEQRISSIIIMQPSGIVFGTSEKPRGGKVQFRHNKTRYLTIGYKPIAIMS